MPELPEVETIRATLDLHLPGKRIREVSVLNRNLRWPVPEQLESKLKGRIFQRIKRRGKYLLICTLCSDTQSEGWVLAHLGMTGTFRLESAQSQTHAAQDAHSNACLTDKHHHILFELDQGDVLIFRDPRRFGAILWTEQDPLQHRLLCHLGPEPLLPDFTPEYLLTQCASRSMSIKSALMHAPIVAGIGNIYACEALFAAKILPQRPAKTLNLQQLKRLVASIRTTLESAIACGGSSIQDFRHIGGELGYFAQKLQVYGREGKACVVCGRLIERAKENNRSTYFCRHCQQ
ncbi:MAG: bifunctional DNA-formamidopyrimidine glycosylase/DNA-(apurinic or apyrimidinic site) lyase [Gammaproteobacteria bacterium]